MLRYSVTDKSQSESYDLECSKDQEVVHVEVKGTTGVGDSVVLTRNEVEHARTYPDTHLFIVGEIRLSYEGNAPVTAGGRLVRHITDWRPLDDDLEATQFRYRVPPE